MSGIPIVSKPVSLPVIPAGSGHVTPSPTPTLAMGIDRYVAAPAKAPETSAPSAPPLLRTSVEQLAVTSAGELSEMAKLTRLLSSNIDALAGEAVNNPRAVGVLFDAWKNGSTEAGEILKMLDITSHTRSANYEPQPVFALSHMMHAGNEAARAALHDLDPTGHRAAARTDPYSVFALTHMQSANNEAAAYTMKYFDVTVHASRASSNPFAVFALSHLTNAGNEAAREAMKHVDPQELVANMANSPVIIPALDTLATAGNFRAIEALEKLSRSYPQAADAVKKMTFTSAHVPTRGMDKAEAWGIVEALYRFADRKSESAFAMLVESAKSTAWAVWLIDRLRFSNSNASAAMKTLAVEAYAVPARTSPDVVITLDLLAYQENEAAREIMRTLDVSWYAQVVATSNDPKLVERLLVALETLARRDNEAALQIIMDGAQRNLTFIIHLRELAKTDGQCGAKVRERLKAIGSTPTVPPQ